MFDVPRRAFSQSGVTNVSVEMATTATLPYLQRRYDLCGEKLASLNETSHHQTKPGSMVPWRPSQRGTGSFFSRKKVGLNSFD